MTEPTLPTGPHDDARTAPFVHGEGVSVEEWIGPYRILQLLGEGGMGTVYLAEQREPVRRRVAVKVIKLGRDTKEVLARFAAERQALAMMEHECIAKVFDAGTTERGQPYFVMEHVAGLPIHEYCDHQRLDTAARLRLFQQVCAGVQHAHQKGIIHRDLKPSNILVVGRDGRPVPKIIDFGVSRAIDQRLVEATIYTEMGRMVGTPEYMSPEQAGTSFEDIDTRTDIYSLGVVLYQLLAGVLPFPSNELRSQSLAEIQRRIREDDPPRPSTRIATRGDASTRATALRSTTRVGLMRQLRGDLDWIVMKAMDKDRNRRYATALYLSDDIERFLAHEPVLAGPPSVGYRLRKFARRYRGRLAAAALVVIALVAGMVTTLIERDRAELNEQRAIGAARAAEESAGRADRERQKAEAAERLAKLRMVTLAARQGQWEEVLGTVDDLLAASPSPDEEVSLLIMKLDALMATGNRDWEAIYERLARIGKSAGEIGPETAVTVEFYRALTGGNWRKTQRTFEQLLRRTDLTPGQRAACQAMTVLSPVEAAGHLRRALDLDGYNDLAMRLLAMICFMTGDQDLMIELRGRGQSVRPNEIGHQCIELYLAMARRQPIAEGVLSDYPELVAMGNRVVQALNEVEPQTIRTICLPDEAGRLAALAEVERILGTATSSMMGATRQLMGGTGGVSTLGMGVPFVATMYRAGASSLRPQEGLLGSLFGKRTLQQEIDAATERIEAVPFQMHYFQRALLRHQRWQETRRAADLIAAVADLRAGIDATPYLVSAEINGLLLLVQYQAELSSEGGTLAADVRERARAGVRSAARALLARPSAGPVLYRWLALRALEAEQPELAMQTVLRWTAEAPDDAEAHLALGLLEYRGGGFNKAYLCATRALELGVSDAATATDLRNKAWARIGCSGLPQDAVLKREGAEPPPVQRVR